MEKIEEITRKEILSGASPEPWKDHMNVRIGGYSIFYTGVSLDEKNNLCVVSFKAKGFGHTSQIQRINLRDFWDIYNEESIKERPLSFREILDMIISTGDVEVYCTCPHWVYGGYAYMASQLDYAYYKKESRFPKVKNPKLQGTTCKHLHLALKVLPNNLTAISNDILKQVEKIRNKKDMNRSKKKKSDMRKKEDMKKR